MKYKASSIKNGKQIQIINGCPKTKVWLSESIKNLQTFIHYRRKHDELPFIDVRNSCSRNCDKRNAYVIATPKLISWNKTGYTDI
jgi:hypothetical protein